MLYIVHERHVDRETVKDVQMKFAYSPETSLQMVFAGILMILANLGQGS